MLYKKWMHNLAALNRSSIQAYARLLRQCWDLTTGRNIHLQLVSDGYTHEIYLSNLLVQMYGRCGSLNDAKLAFDALECKNVYSWTILITAFARLGQNKTALLLYRQMQQQGIKPSQVTLVAIFDACSNMLERPIALRHARMIHDSIDGEMILNIFVENTLISMYGKCGGLVWASAVFESMRLKDVVSWTAIIAAHTLHGHCKKALELYRDMISAHTRPTEITYAAVLGACCTPEDLETGKWIHSQASSDKLQDKFSVGTALVIMYIKCGSLADARETFESLQCRNVVCWNAMVAAYSQAGLDDEAINLFHRMNLEGGTPNEITFSTVVSACSKLGAFPEGQKVHALIPGTILEFDEVLGNTLISFYGTSGSPASASKVFSSMINKSIVSWNAMIAACSQNGDFERVLLLFKQLDLEGLKVNDFTFVAAIDACASTENIDLGRVIHARVVAEGLEHHPIVGTSIVELYGKSGKLAEAKQAFEKLPAKDSVTWNALVAAYSKLGDGRSCLTSLQEMNCEGFIPNGTIFTNVLSACSHSGLGREAWDCFHSMAADYGVDPVQDHYGCMVDLLCRSGRVQEMNSLIKTWSSLLHEWNQQMEFENLRLHVEKCLTS